MIALQVDGIWDCYLLKRNVVFTIDLWMMPAGIILRRKYSLTLKFLPKTTSSAVADTTSTHAIIQVVAMAF